MSGKRAVMLLFASVSLLLWQSVSAQNSVTLDLGFYTDGTCDTRSQTTPNASLALSVCAATLGALSIFVPTFPCAGTDVKLLGFVDTGCKTSSDSFFTSSGCYEYFGGSFGSILLACDSTSSSGQQPAPVIASYTTISVGPVAADATGSASGSSPTTSSGGSSSSGGSTSSGSGGSSSSSTGTSTHTSGSSSAATSTASNNSQQSSSGSFDSLPIGTRIGIIVGAVVGGILIISGVWTCIAREIRHRRDHQIAMHQYEQSVYRPSTYPATSGMALQSPHNASQGYAASRYPVTDVDWEQENNRHMGSQLGSADIEDWRDRAHTVAAQTQR